MVNKVFCFGAGFSVRALFRYLEEIHAGDWDMVGTTRTGRDGTHIFSPDHPLNDAMVLLNDVTHLVISVPPSETGDPVLNIHGNDISAMKKLRWIGYLSTTGGYGDHKGAWVDEETPLSPTTVRGERRKLAEEAWTQLGEKMGIPVHVFRLAGIYGPGRNQIVSLLEGRARRVVKPGQVFSRIHVDDIAQIVAKAMQSDLSSRAFNVCDDESCPPQDVVEYAANMINVPLPPETPFDSADLSPMAKSFYADNKRVRNERIKKQLGVQLKYPNYREGLQACLAYDHGTG